MSGEGTMGHETRSVAPNPPRRLFRRGPWENAATAVIACGVVMLMQPFSLTLYTYSFVTTLVGTLMFIVVSKFPD
jgi:uncharacterized membrane protein YjjP (DUF1212 family)